VIRLLRAGAALWRVSVAEMLQYRGELALWAIWGIIYPLVALAMWNAAILGGEDRADIHGFGPREFAGYFLMTMIAGHFVTAWDAYEMGYLVRTGALSPQLLRPVLPIWRSLCDNVAYKVVTLGILVPCWLIVAWFTQPRIEAGVGQLAAGAAALCLGAVLAYLWSYNIALVAFWSTRTDAIAECWFGASLIFGGRLAPLNLLPWPLQIAANALPIKWAIWFPAEVLMGRIAGGELAGGLIWQGGWIAAAVLVFQVLWRAGLKRYSAVGA
jgi:ABC-2 type transport system permease protein